MAKHIQSSSDTEAISSVLALCFTCTVSLTVTTSARVAGKRSRRKGKVPVDWRKASVTPIFKKGKKEDPGNNRPVSLTSIPGRLMEQLILDVIIKQVEEKKVIRSSQHGFTKRKSCLTNLITFCNGMTG